MYLIYNDTTGFIVAFNNDPGMSAGSGETLVTYAPEINEQGHSKVDIAALPTISIISKTAQEITDFDDAILPATGSDWETIYLTKVTQADKDKCFCDMIKLMCDGQATIKNVADL